jgi:tetratricopeptide (TPR) repeat protein
MPALTLWFQPAVGGLLVGVLGWFVPQVLGVGYGYVSQALNGQMALRMMALLVILKLVATATCYASGNAGGIFGPSLFIGAMLGGAFGGTAHAVMPDYTASVGAYALVGMGAAFAGIVRVPLTSVIMIFEVTRDYSIIVPLMISNLISYFVSSRLQRTPIYEALLEQDGIHPPTAARDREELLTVGQACRPAVAILAAGEPVAQAAARVGNGESACPVVQDGALLGMVTPGQLETAIRAGQGNDPVSALLPAGPAEAGTEFPHTHADDPVDTAMRSMAHHGLNVLPVVSRADMRVLTGVVSVRDILAAYGLEGNRPPVEERAGGESRASARALAGALVVLVLTVALATFLGVLYRSARAVRARQNFSDGNALMAAGRFEEAIEKYRAAVSISHTEQHRLALALALLQASHLNEAQIYLSELLREDPNNGPANLGLGRIQAQQGDLREAVRVYHRAIYGTWPSDPLAHRVQARLELIDALGKADHRDQVRAELLSLKSEMPGDPALRRRIGHLFLTFGMPAEAAAVFRDLLKTNRNDDDAFAGLGEAELARDDLAAAQAAFDGAARHKPDNVAYRDRADLLDKVISMDPVMRGLDRARRYHRSRTLLEAALAAFYACRAAPPLQASDSSRETAGKARQLLQRSSAPRSYSDATDANIELARELWNERVRLCGAPETGEEALSRAMAEVSR